MNFFDLSFWQNFVSNSLATILGAFLGILGALWVSNYLERRTEKERVGKILSILYNELKSAKETIDDWRSNRIEYRKKWIYKVILIKDENWKAFADGGELEWLNDLDILTWLAEAYFAIRLVNFYSEKTFQVYQTAASSEEISGYTTGDFDKKLEDTTDYARRIINVALHELSDPRRNFLKS